LSLFGPPLLLAGEDASTYDQLVGSVYAAVKPVDFIEEIFTHDIVSLEWAVLRWRRLHNSLIQANLLPALESFLAENLDYVHYRQLFTEDLAEILEDNLPEEEVKGAQTLARQCARNEPDADEKVNKLLGEIGKNMDAIVDAARARKAEDLVQNCMRGKREAVTLIQELLTRAGISMDSLLAGTMPERLEDIERVDRLASIAESRRNASLREIERRRSVFGEKLRRTVQQIEHNELKAIETKPANGKHAA
jgi:hypothetical protein